MPGKAGAKRRRPWYRRPLPVVSLLLVLLVTLAAVPPLLAGPTPVTLNEEGQENARTDGWASVELGAEASWDQAGGLVTLDTRALQKNDTEGYPVAGYTWASLKLPAMLPRSVVEDRLQESALEAVKEVLSGLSLEGQGDGITLDTTPIEETTFTGNGHDVRLGRYQASARLTDQLPAHLIIDEEERLHGEAFIATWRCSVLGSYAMALGVARDEPVFETTLGETTDTLEDPLDADLGDLADGDGLADGDIQITVDEVRIETSASDHIQAIQDRLLANTVCGD